MKSVPSVVKVCRPVSGANANPPVSRMPRISRLSHKGVAKEPVPGNAAFMIDMPGRMTPVFNAKAQGREGATKAKAEN
ncbi:MAG: hypothetical protein ABSG78_23280 [Verrucomicrobiota bacterium]